VHTDPQIKQKNKAQLFKQPHTKKGCPFEQPLFLITLKTNLTYEKNLYLKYFKYRAKSITKIFPVGEIKKYILLNT
jgi:hypothetical protein